MVWESWGGGLRWIGAMSGLGPQSHHLGHKRFSFLFLFWLCFVVFIFFFSFFCFVFLNIARQHQ